MTGTMINVSPVGFVRLESGGFYLEIAPEYRAALNGLEGFSHINVLWWSHLLEAPECRAIVECDQPYQNAPARVGIFATRSPLRPNPIALSVAPVLHIDVESGRIDLGYIDAEDGTPVLDIKPYHPCADRVRDVQTPGWCAHWPQWFEDSAEFDWQAEFVTAR